MAQGKNRERAVTVPTDIDCFGNHNCVCPYCGHQDRDSWELTEDSGTVECGACSRPYTYSRVVNIEYSTRPIMGPHQQDELQQRWELEHEQDKKL